MKLSIKLDDSKLLSALDRFPDAVLNNIKDALHVGSRDIQDHARQNHRYTTRSGHLANSIRNEVDESLLVAYVGLDTGVAHYGEMVHDGTKSHFIFPKQRKALRFVAGNRIAFSKRVRHPGTKPDKFIEKAGRDKEQETNRLFTKAVENAARGSFG